MVPASNLARTSLVFPVIEVPNAKFPPLLMLRGTFFAMLVGLGRWLPLLDNAICSVGNGTLEMLGSAFRRSKTGVGSESRRGGLACDVL